MLKWTEACKRSEVGDGAMKPFGKLEGTVITCPLHGSQFDITDGHVIRWTNLSGFMAKVGQAVKPAKPLATYRVKLEGDAVMVEI
jgi:3-phenylpropionate/trans-cinnamate dioxygenase ferredoxin subunit